MYYGLIFNPGLNNLTIFNFAAFLSWRLLLLPAPATAYYSVSSSLPCAAATGALQPLTQQQRLPNCSSRSRSNNSAAANSVRLQQLAANATCGEGGPLERSNREDFTQQRKKENKLFSYSSFLKMINIKTKAADKKEENKGGDTPKKRLSKRKLSGGASPYVLRCMYVHLIVNACSACIGIMG